MIIIIIICIFYHIFCNVHRLMSFRRNKLPVCILKFSSLIKISNWFINKFRHIITKSFLLRNHESWNRNETITACIKAFSYKFMNFNIISAHFFPFNEFWSNLNTWKFKGPGFICTTSTASGRKIAKKAINPPLKNVILLREKILFSWSVLSHPLPPDLSDFYLFRSKFIKWKKFSQWEVDEFAK